ncbi:nuclease-related domain-containing protein [Jeotgalibaca dankookensis]|uniref:nuclease-related domain-containing protein n=1 Tax=Jeotgalibaca dankookensis TaxID=708126 RepID=UPI000784EC9D|nr:nuclease-related domain-containing protein [Jeotgalibaca dankookensis]
MLIKERNEPINLKIMTALNTRMSLSKEHQRYYHNLKSGYEGECLFDQYVKEYVPLSCAVLNDLQLKIYTTDFQIDTLIIHDQTISIYEIKNYQTDITYHHNNFITKSGTIITNPLGQLNRTETALRNWLKLNRLTYDVEAYVCFINPEAMIYGAPYHPNIIYACQLSRHLKNLNPHTSKAEQLMKTLMENHIADFRSGKDLPDYQKETIKKGVACRYCHSFETKIKDRTTYCLTCGQTESTQETMNRQIAEFQVLFPEELLDTAVLHDWCKKQVSKQRLYRQLAKV